MIRFDEFDDLRTVAQLEGGSIQTARDGADYLLITDESALADFLGADDTDLLDHLVTVRRFATATDRDKAAAAVLPVSLHSPPRETLATLRVATLRTVRPPSPST